MEFAAAAMTAITAAVSTVGTAVSSAAGAAGSALGMGASAGSAGLSLSSVGSFLGSALQGGLGLMGAMSAARQGQAKEEYYVANAENARIDARQAELDQQPRELSLRRALIQEIGQRDVAYAASGVDLSFGTPNVARLQATEDTAAALGLERTQTEMRALRYREKASSYEATGAEARLAGGEKAAGLLGQTALSIFKRG